MIYFKDKDEKKHAVDVYTIIENGKVTICLDNYFIKTLKVYFRNEKTWDDHLGNTPCGYYINLPLPWGGKKRIYIHFKGWQ